MTKNKNHTKVKRLFEEKMFKPCAFQSVLVRTLSDKQTQSNTVRKARLEPAIRMRRSLRRTFFRPEKHIVVRRARRFLVTWLGIKLSGSGDENVKSRAWFLGSWTGILYKNVKVGYKHSTFVV